MNIFTRLVFLKLLDDERNERHVSHYSNLIWKSYFRLLEIHDSEAKDNEDQTPSKRAKLR